MSARPAITDIGKPDATALAKMARSGVTPNRACVSPYHRPGERFLGRCFFHIAECALHQWQQHFPGKFGIETRLDQDIPRGSEQRNQGITRQYRRGVIRTALIIL